MEEKAPEKPGTLAWIKKRIISFLGLLLAVAIVLAVALVYKKDPGIFTRLQGYGYLGAFIISIILNATIILPVSNVLLMTAIGMAVPHPWLVGVLGGLAAGIGEMTGYLAGRAGRGILAKNKMYARIEGWVKKWGWFAVFFLSIIPFAFDVVGITAGALRMPVWRFMLACAAGRLVFYVAAIYLAIAGINILPHWF
jgi:membrane protein YqaA with SNARE-associated domain